MAQNFHVRKPVQSLSNINSSTNIPAGSWVQIAASTTYAAAHMTAFNSGAAPVQISTGAAGSEKVLCTVGINESLSIPVELLKNTRIAAQSISGTLSTGYLTINLLG